MPFLLCHRRWFRFFLNPESGKLRCHCTGTLKFGFVQTLHRKKSSSPLLSLTDAAGLLLLLHCTKSPPPIHVQCGSMSDYTVHWFVCFFAATRCQMDEMSGSCSTINNATVLLPHTCHTVRDSNPRTSCQMKCRKTQNRNCTHSRKIVYLDVQRTRRR